MNTSSVIWALLSWRDQEGRGGRDSAMTRYCAHCGSSLETTALRIGHCTICGTEIDAADVGLGPNDNDAAATDSPTQPTPSTYAAAGGVGGMPDPHADSAHPTPVQPQRRHSGAGAGSQRDAPRGQQRVPSRWALLLLSAVLLLLVGAAIYALAQHGALSIDLGPFTLSGGNANASSDSSSVGPTST